MGYERRETGWEGTEIGWEGTKIGLRSMVRRDTNGVKIVFHKISLSFSNQR